MTPENKPSAANTDKIDWKNPENLQAVFDIFASYNIRLNEIDKERVTNLAVGQEIEVAGWGLARKIKIKRSVGGGFVLSEVPIGPVDE